MKHKNGFTLIELLVVIAIISILLVMALPSLFSNIEKAKIADLESDISSIKSTMLTYYSDKSSMINSRNWLIIYKDHNGNVKYAPDLPGHTPEEIKHIKSDIENLSIPFGYYLIDFYEDSTAITILFDENEFVKAPKISLNGIKKLKRDFGDQVKYIEKEQKIIIKLT